MSLIQDFIGQLLSLRRVIITTHVRPDGDALGSVGAMALALRSRGIETDQLLLSKMPGKYRFVFEEAGLTHIDADRDGVPDLSKYDGLLICDTGTFSQLPGLEQKIQAYTGKILVLDHHKTQEPWGTARLVDVTVSSAAELAARVIREMGVPIDRKMGEAIYAGVVSDTGWFQFSNTGPATMRLAADLMEVGVDPDRMYQRLYLQEKEARIRLQTRALDSLQLLAGGKLAVMRIRKSDFLETGAVVPDTENVINIPLQIGSVEMSLLATEPPEAGGGPVRISCRSKGRVDVARFAEEFGGGGHARASGLKVAGDFDDVVSRVSARAQEAVTQLS